MNIYDANVADFPRLPGETDDSPRIDRAIEAAAGGELYVPKGVYEIATPIEVKGYTSIQFHSSAVLRAVKEMDYVLSYDGSKQENKENSILAGQSRNLYLKGGVIDGNGLANCVYIQRVCHYTLSDMHILNGKKYGLYTGDVGCELIGSNLYINCTMPGLKGNVGMCLTMGDCHYHDCVIVDYTVGVEIYGGSNRLDRIHVWGGPVRTPEDHNISEYLLDSISFHVPFKHGFHDVVLRDCYADTACIGFLIEDHTRMYGCSYFNNYDVFSTIDNPTIIDHRDGYLYCDGLKCTFGSPNGTYYKGGAKGKLIWGNNYKEAKGFAEVLTLEELVK